MSDVRGFTFTEVLVALTLAAITAGAAFVLLDAGIDLHESGDTIGRTATGSADVLIRLRSDVARCSEVQYAGVDSLHLALPNGDAVAWTARSTGSGLAVYRSIDRGSGLVEAPMRALTRLENGPSSPATLRFQQLALGRVRAHLISRDRNFSIEAARWSTP